MHRSDIAGVTQEIGSAVANRADRRHLLFGADQGRERRVDNRRIDAAQPGEIDVAQGEANVCEFRVVERTGRTLETAFDDQIGRRHARCCLKTLDFLTSRRERLARHRLGTARRRQQSAA